ERQTAGAIGQGDGFRVGGIGAGLQGAVRGNGYVAAAGHAQGSPAGQDQPGRATPNVTDLQGDGGAVNRQGVGPLVPGAVVDGGAQGDVVAGRHVQRDGAGSAGLHDAAGEADLAEIAARGQSQGAAADAYGAHVKRARVGDGHGGTGAADRYRTEVIGGRG